MADGYQAARRLSVPTGNEFHALLVRTGASQGETGVAARRCDESMDAFMNGIPAQRQR